MRARQRKPGQGPVEHASWSTSSRVALLLSVALVLLPAAAYAADTSVPVSLQAELMLKIAGYDRNFRKRAGSRAQIALLVRKGNAASDRVASQMARALAGAPDIAGLPHDEVRLEYAGAAALAQACNSQHIAVVYLPPGLEAETAAIGLALGVVSVLTVTAVAEEVPKGIVLGFDLVDSRPKLLVNLAQARSQDVDLPAIVLKLAKVYP